MKIELWTDIICPWCGLGNHNLGLALRDFAERDRVELVHRSFQLDPDAPADVVRPVPQMLREKGYTDTQITGMTHRIEKMAREQGLQPYIVLDNTVGNTALAHELAAWASEQGKGGMWRLCTGPISASSVRSSTSKAVALPRTAASSRQGPRGTVIAPLS